MVKISPGYIWQRGDDVFIGGFYLKRGEEAFELCKTCPLTASHHKRDVILTRMLEW